MTRETVGKLSVDLLIKDEPQHTVVDMQREMQKDYEKHFFEALESGKKQFEGDFYIVVMTKGERVLTNVIRNFFLARKSCPTPTYDNTVYRYIRAEDHIEFLWVIPSKKSCEYLKQNMLEVSPEEKDLLHFVLDFYDGALDIRAKKLNGELDN